MGVGLRVVRQFNRHTTYDRSQTTSALRHSLGSRSESFALNGTPSWSGHLHYESQGSRLYLEHHVALDYSPMIEDHSQTSSHIAEAQKISCRTSVVQGSVHDHS